MSQTLIVNNQTFETPTDGTQPNWAEEIDGWMREVTEVLNSLDGEGNILQTTFDIANNQPSYVNVDRLAFSASVVRAAFVKYSVYRTTSTAEIAEAGMFYLIYKNTANTWSISVQKVGDASMEFTVTNSGQIQYKSSNMSGLSYSGTIVFESTALRQ